MMREILAKDMSLWIFVWQSTLFAAIGLVGAFIFRRRPARAFGVLFLTMVAAVLLPARSCTISDSGLSDLIGSHKSLPRRRP